MQVVYAADGDIVKELEKDIIKTLIEESGKVWGSERCENQRKGGEQARPGEVTFLYICHSTLDEHCKLAGHARAQEAKARGVKKIAWNEHMERKRSRHQ